MLLKKIKVASLLVGLLPLTSCATYIASGQYQPPATAEEYVPEGYMPPAGQCRIWYDDRQPQQQPPVGRCSELQKQIPTNGRLLTG